MQKSQKVGFVSYEDDAGDEWRALGEKAGHGERQATD
jgi:hypothetical protein